MPQELLTVQHNSSTIRNTNCSNSSRSAFHSIIIFHIFVAKDVKVKMGVLIVENRREV